MENTFIFQHEPQLYLAKPKLAAQPVQHTLCHMGEVENIRPRPPGPARHLTHARVTQVRVSQNTSLVSVQAHGERGRQPWPDPLPNLSLGKLLHPLGLFPSLQDAFTKWHNDQVQKRIDGPRSKPTFREQIRGHRYHRHHHHQHTTALRGGKGSGSPGQETCLFPCSGPCPFGDHVL